MKLLKEIAWACFKCYNLQFPLSILKFFVGVSENFYFKYCNTSPLKWKFLKKKIGFRKLSFFQIELTFTKMVYDILNRLLWFLGSLETPRNLSM